MRELVFLRAGKLAWREVPAPTLQSERDALVRPFIAARCDGDAFYLRHDFGKALRVGARLHVIDDGFRSARTDPFAGPFAYGHECVAEVLSVGSEVRSFAAGDVVIVPWALSCGACAPCGSGLTTKCSTARGDDAVAAYGFGPAFGAHGGMLSDVVRVPWAEAMLVRVPDGIEPLAVASASDNLADGYRAVAHPLRRNPGAPVLIVGGGAKSIGLYAAGIARALGSTRVDYVDTSRTRLQIAERLGANPIELVKGAKWYRRGQPMLDGGHPISVDASSTTAGLAYALNALAPGGTTTGVGFYVRRGTPLPLWNMYLKSATLHVGVAHARAELPHLLTLLRQGTFDPKSVTSLVAGWDEAPQALLERSTKLVLQRPRLDDLRVSQDAKTPDSGL